AGAAAALLTEGLSSMNQVNTLSLAAAYGVLDVILLVWLVRDKRAVVSAARRIPEITRLKVPPIYGVLALFGVLFVLVPLLFAALYYPPNTPDSMNYHLPRIEHWIQNGNVGHFPTLDIRQNMLNVFSEYLMLHLRLLGGSDFLLNLAQFGAMGLSILVASLMAKAFGGAFRAQILGAVLVLALPMGICQATSTQADYVSAFLFFSFIYFGYRLSGAGAAWKDLSFSAISLSLGVMAKNTVYLFALPFCLWFGAGYLRRHKGKAIGIAALFFVSIAVFNGPFYFRNYQAYRSIVGECDECQNEDILIWDNVSNVIRNLGLHAGLPLGPYNRFVDGGVRWAHRLLNVPIDRPGNTVPGNVYETTFSINEDWAGNGVLLLLSFAAMAGLFYKRKMTAARDLWLYGSALAGGFIIYSFVIRWQPWGSRLQLPLFVAACPVVGLVWENLLRGPAAAVRQNASGGTGGLLASAWPSRACLFAGLASLGLGAGALASPIDFDPILRALLARIEGLAGAGLWAERAARVLSAHLKQLIGLNLIVAGLVLWLAAPFLLHVRRYLRAGHCWEADSSDGRAFLFSIALLLLSLPYVYINRHKPLLGVNHALMNQREVNYFLGLGNTAAEKIGEEYERAARSIVDSGRKNVGLDIVHQNEVYPWWILLKRRDAAIRIGYFWTYVNLPSGDSFDAVISEDKGILRELEGYPLESVEHYEVPYLSELERDQSLHTGEFWVVFPKSGTTVP
ncbi:MAG: hypothetical protein HY548_05595, partial [Elusimicrobia bacterium]|nr:hypothetical protein [Elusimicrobiota bacterium]